MGLPDDSPRRVIFRIGLFVLTAVASMAAAHAVAAQQSAVPDSIVTRLVTPERTDSAIHRYLEPNLVTFEARVKMSAPLLVFLAGTGGRPANTGDFALAAARQGYRVIGLEYDNIPAVAQICARNPNANCSANVREKRVYGHDVTRLIDDRPEESIVNRLTKLLMTLGREYPDEGWQNYLEDDQPNWPRIAVAGLSQGAGMAAFIAQRAPVVRVILFSSPWDNYGPRRTLSPWITAGAGRTSPDRWFAAYHRRELSADVIDRAYRALGIPAKQIRVFSLEPAAKRGPNPYHASVVGDGVTPRSPAGLPAYLEEWKFLLGNAR